VRKLLSIDRRLGPQGCSDAISGRAQRHAVGWRELQPTVTPWPLAIRAAILAGLVILLWSLIFGGVWSAVQIVDWMWGVA
jgi:hypothetical protein